MEAFKFLRTGAVGPFSGFAWPTPSADGPGAWVAPSDQAPPPLADAVRGCALDQLAYWVSDELWRLELEAVEVSARSAAGSRGRLLDRIEGWDMGAIAEYVPACVSRGSQIAEAASNARVSAYAVEAAKHGPRGPAMAGFQAAHVAGIAAIERGEDYEAGARAERAWQSSWIAERVGLETAP